MQYSSDEAGRNAELAEAGGVIFVRFAHIHRTGIWAHGISTRIGGVSRGPYDSMNLGFTTMDVEPALAENRRRFSTALGIGKLPLVQRLDLVHGNRVIELKESDTGELLAQADGIVTDMVDRALITTFADCIPLILADPATGAIGVIHSGWRGTFAGIAGEAVKKMTESYGSKPENILAGIGPGIGRCCFETGKDVADAFFDKFGRWKDLTVKTSNKDKWFIDLKGLSERILTDSGLIPENIATANLCTCCRRDLFFSYRRDGGISGRMAAAAARLL